jgi:hypothetical protein
MNNQTKNFMPNKIPLSEHTIRKFTSHLELFSRAVRGRKALIYAVGIPPQQTVLLPQSQGITASYVYNKLT